MHGQAGTNIYTFGKAHDQHDYHLPLICELNTKIRNDGVTFCDLPPGNSGFVRVALEQASAAAVVTKPNRGWQRDVEIMTGMLSEMGIPYGVIVNKIKNEESFVHEVENYCSRQNISLLGKVPSDQLLEREFSFVDSINGDDLKSIFAGILKQTMELVND